MGIRRIEASFHAGGGRLLFRRAWLPEAPERLLVVVHGFAEHSGRYEGFGSWFAQRGAVRCTPTTIRDTGGRPE
jgi:alpha-beta hydrolase superfamily lysophospholipase